MLNPDFAGPPSLIGRAANLEATGATPTPNGQPDELWELPEAKVQRLNVLSQRNNGGGLTAEERRELADLVAEYEALVMHNAQVRLWRNDPNRFREAQARASAE